MFRVLQDQGGREYMEDTYVAIPHIVPGTHLFAVFDGHAGDKVALYLKDNVPIFAKKQLEASTSLEQAIFQIFVDIMKHIPKSMATHTGSTAVVMLQQGSTVVIANCGDSRAIMNHGPRAVDITVDHKPDREIQRIQQAGGFVTFQPMDVPRVHGHLAVSRSIGDLYLFPSVTWKPEIFRCELTPQTTYIVLATDGVWDALTSQEAVDLMEDQWQTELPKGDAMQIAIQQMLIVARRRGSSDNITILAISTQP